MARVDWGSFTAVIQVERKARYCPFRNRMSSFKEPTHKVFHVIRLAGLILALTA